MKIKKFEENTIAASFSLILNALTTANYLLKGWEIIER